MNIRPQQHDTMKKIADLVKGINVCMLTAGSSGRLISHPMYPLELDEHGDFWFFASRHSAAQLDLSFVNIAFSDEDRSIHISLSGKAALARDRARIDELWTPGIRPWFSRGADDPDLSLLKFSTHTAAYWDAKNSKMVRLLASMGATVFKRPTLQTADHEVLANPTHS